VEGGRWKEEGRVARRGKLEAGRSKGEVDGRGWIPKGPYPECGKRCQSTHL